MRRMKQHNLFVLTTLAVIAIFGCTGSGHNPVSREAAWDRNTRQNEGCGAVIDLNDQINQNLSSADRTTAVQAKSLLLQYAKESPTCRSEIIAALIKAMDKPRLNLVTDRRSYILWSNGSAMLGELKAVEALDLLIEHLDLNDGEFGASLAHQPAVLGVRLMGNLALSKLIFALQYNSNRNIRLAAVLCLDAIREEEAMNAMKHALNSESDSCVRRLIQISIELSEINMNSKSQRSKKAKDRESGLRRQLLLAFRCDN